ncbi:unnamed protein product [Dovyalis caffra]|uniref:Uncharacterized protein n=1 Tax=Dovyalis caffra TaxID=77055 RepID=A0AAV1QQA8_9ROSI|nr:unnamed protein product [Dovyalis caffra]
MQMVYLMQMVHADESVCRTWDYLKQHGSKGFINIRPRPTAIAWTIIACYAAFEAAILLPGKRAEGPISPDGNRRVYKLPNIGKTRTYASNPAQYD